jgi:hypothetical protein
MKTMTPEIAVDVVLSVILPLSENVVGVVVVVVVLFVGDPSQAATKTATRRTDVDQRWPLHRRRRTECTDRVTAAFLEHITVTTERRASCSTFIAGGSR